MTEITLVLTVDEAKRLVEALDCQVPGIDEYASDFYKAQSRLLIEFTDMLSDLIWPGDD